MDINYRHQEVSVLEREKDKLDVSFNIYIKIINK